MFGACACARAIVVYLFAAGHSSSRISPSTITMIIIMCMGNIIRFPIRWCSTILHGEPPPGNLLRRDAVILLTFYNYSPYCFVFHFFFFFLSTTVHFYRSRFVSRLVSGRETEDDRHVQVLYVFEDGDISRLPKNHCDVFRSQLLVFTGTFVVIYKLYDRLNV